jgi:beta-glucosidase
MGDHGASMSFDPLDPGPYASVNLADQPHYNVLTSALGSGKQVILVIVSGRPLVLPSEVVNGCDAIVAAWLPGSRGRGVAEVLYGEYDFEGVLPHTWPADFGQIPINVGKFGDEPGLDANDATALYRYGDGLRYNE